MFDRFLRFAEARSALAREHFEHALELLADPLVRAHRKADALRQEVLTRLVLRAERRRAGGEIALALADARAVLRRCPEHEQARSLERTLVAAQAARDVDDASARKALGDARATLDRGEPAAAERLLENLAPSERNGEDVAALRRRIAACRGEATNALASARVALRAGRVRDAHELLMRVRRSGTHEDDATSLAHELAVASARAALDTLDVRASADELARIVKAHGLQLAELPELAEHPEVQRAQAVLADRAIEWLRAGIVAEGCAAALARARALDARFLGVPAARELAAAIEDLARGVDLSERGDLDGAAQAYASAGERIGAKELARAAAELRAGAQACDEALGQAREHVREGKNAQARKHLLAALAQWPAHEGVRKELATLDQNAAERERRLASARALALEGRLQGARRTLIDLTSAGDEGEAARALLAEVETKIDVVERGLAQVQRSLHGRASGSSEGIRHCMLRVDQLARVQSDSEELARLRGALAAEIDGIEAIDAAQRALETGDAAALAEQVERIRAASSALIDQGRLRARSLALGDRIHALTETALASGATNRARGLTGALRELERDTDRAASLEVRIADQVQRGRAAAEEALARLGRRELDAAKACLERARALAADVHEVTRAESEFRRCFDQEHGLAQVEALARGSDFAGAHAKLGSLPPTPPLLRTRVFDIKQGLARAQGLDGGFLLRVDEGGELLVLRADSISIGNVRDGRCDLALLANVASRHARVQRSMSFHGGMQDRVLAERGEVRVNGVPTTDRVLRSGDRVRLGANAELLYEMPVARSLTARLTLGSGVQVAGTSRVLLLKDRGRDGRILIGPGPETHVRVPGATSEIEVYAAKDGQVMVRCEGQSEMNGKPFSGEHPVTAGALVRCNGVTFVLHPVAK